MKFKRRTDAQLRKHQKELFKLLQYDIDERRTALDRDIFEDGRKESIMPWIELIGRTEFPCQTIRYRVG